MESLWMQTLHVFPGLGSRQRSQAKEPLLRRQTFVAVNSQFVTDSMLASG